MLQGIGATQPGGTPVGGPVSAQRVRSLGSVHKSSLQRVHMTPDSSVLSTQNQSNLAYPTTYYPSTTYYINPATIV